MNPPHVPRAGLLTGINVGFDLHDKFFDILPKFQEILTMRTGVTIPLQQLRKELVLLDGRITLEQYNDAKELLFEQPHFFRQVPSLSGAAARIVDFYRQGARLISITASGDQALRNIKNWDRHHGELSPHVTIHSSGWGGSKVQLAKRFKLHYFSDNKLQNIFELRHIVPRLCFFLRPNNWHEVKWAIRFGARIIESWDEFYEYILKDAPRLHKELSDFDSRRIRSFPHRKRNSNAPLPSGVIVRTNPTTEMVDRIIDDCLLNHRSFMTPAYK